MRIRMRMRMRMKIKVKIKNNNWSLTCSLAPFLVGSIPTLPKHTATHATKFLTSSQNLCFKLIVRYNYIWSFYLYICTYTSSSSVTSPKLAQLAEHWTFKLFIRVFNDTVYENKSEFNRIQRSRVPQKLTMRWAGTSDPQEHRVQTSFSPAFNNLTFACNKKCRVKDAVMWIRSTWQLHGFVQVQQELQLRGTYCYR